MPSLGIVLLCVCAAVFYGIVHDQVTARICLEYFTIGHPRLIASDSPTVLAFFWGIVATWWVGLPLGIVLAFAARAGRLPKLGPQELVRHVLKLLLVMLLIAFIAGVLGFVASNAGLLHLRGPLGHQVPPEKHIAFLVDASAHSASYLAGFVGGTILCVTTWRRRAKTAISSRD